MIRTSIRLLNDGVVKFDGGTMFGSVPKAVWEQSVSVDRKNRITMGLNCLLIQVGDKNILIDTGAGNKEMNGKRETFGLQPSKLMKNLKDIGVSPKEIDTVVLTHLHFDHVGGCSRMDRSGNLVPTFPKASYYVQRSAWEEADTPNERAADYYNSDDLDALADTGRLVLLDGDMEIFPGIYCKTTHGHTKGHQMVLVNQGGERVVFLGDMVPTPYHLEMACISSYDMAPDETLEFKRGTLQQAVRDGWLLIFYHGWDKRAGYLEMRNNRAALRPVEF
jgi:glyoxylase-like metal-dependent hydrolase (beta-lactamase superfamily II)